MPQYRSGTNRLSNELSSGDILDDSGKQLVNVGVGFGDAPVSESIVAQVKYGVPNGQFNLLPQEAYSAIGPDNDLPYWKVEDLCDTTGAIEAKITTTDGGLTYGLTIDPTGAILDDSIVITARAPVLTDTNLSLRQKLVSTLTKSSAYSSTNQWNLTASATYYDHSNVQLDSRTIGTAAHNASWTQLGGTTTTGGSAIPGGAKYVDIAFTLTALATVTDTTTVTINSVLLADSAPATGSFLVTQTFLASGTWTRPTGVDYVSVALIGGGNGGQPGAAALDASSSNVGSRGGAGGNSGQHLVVRDIYVGDVSTVAVGVGAGGAGGVPGTALKPNGGTFPTVNTSRISSTGGSSAAIGGASSFGSYVINKTGSGTVLADFTGPSDASLAYGYDLSTWARGGTAADTTTGGTALGAGAGSATFGGGRTIVPLQNVAIGTGVVVSGGTGYYTTTTSGTGWSYLFISSQPGGVSSGLAGGGAGGGGVANNTGTANAVSNGGSAAGTTNGGPGGGAGWLLANMQTASAGRVIAVYGGPGGNAGFGGGGGGGGGPAWLRWSNVNNTIYAASTFTGIGGEGGDGSDGYVVISYVA